MEYFYSQKGEAGGEGGGQENHYQKKKELFQARLPSLSGRQGLTIQFAQLPLCVCVCVFTEGHHDRLPHGY